MAAFTISKGTASLACDSTASSSLCDFTHRKPTNVNIMNIQETLMVMVRMIRRSSLLLFGMGSGRKRKLKIAVIKKLFVSR